jgi:hypothetical protein
MATTKPVQTFPFGFLHLNTTVDITPDVIGHGDAVNELILLIMWLGAAYAIGMIWSTVALCDRWRGPHGKSKIGFVSVVAAFLISAAWPLVGVYLFMSK